MELIRYYYFGYKGVIQKNTDSNKGSIEFFRSHELTEIELQSLLKPEISQNLNGWHEIDEKISRTYQEWNNYGYHGDVIIFTVTSDASILWINYIGKLSNHRPSLAVDILPFIIDKRGEVYFIGITRKYQPGQGKFALIGGHLDFIGSRLERPAEAAVREAGEEVNGLNIELSNYDYLSGYQEILLPHEIVTVRLGQNETANESKTTMNLLGTFPTSSDELAENQKYKRVDWTVAYYLPIKLDFDADLNVVRSWIKAGDDASSVEVFKLDSDLELDFAFGHHEAIFHLATRQLSINRDG